jgi:hypothetical protein
LGGTRIHDTVVIGDGFNGQSIFSDAIGRSCNPLVPEAGSNSSLLCVCQATSKPHSSVIAG